MFVSFAGKTFVTTVLPQFLNVNLTQLSGIQLTVSFSPFVPSQSWNFNRFLLMLLIVHFGLWAVNRVLNQENAWRFNEHLSKIPAAVRFVSYEPALGPVTDLDWPQLDWLIYGGESGKDFRPHDISWARQAKTKCDENRIPFFYKQGSAFKPGQDKLLDGELIQNYPKPRVK